MPLYCPECKSRLYPVDNEFIAKYGKCSACVTWKTKNPPGAILIPDPEETTCWGCSESNECPWAFDAYNTNGDCLASK
jgi:hypothetical protein